MPAFTFEYNILLPYQFNNSIEPENDKHLHSWEGTNKLDYWYRKIAAFLDNIFYTGCTY